MKTKVAFVYTNNSCRSIMAERFLRYYNDGDFEVYSAETKKTFFSKTFSD